MRMPTLLPFGDGCISGEAIDTGTRDMTGLMAIFAADVEGYSRLMGADEDGTFKDLTVRPEGADH